MPIRLHIYFDITNQPWGGGNSFLKALRKTFLEKKEFEIEIIESAHASYDILLINGGHAGPGRLIKPRHIRNLKRWGYKTLWHYALHGFRPQPKKVVYRLDGARKVYAGQVDAMYRVQQACLKLADHIIFQSQFSVQTFADQGIVATRYSIVHNGVDPSFFPMSSELRCLHEPLRIIAASWSKNIMKGHETIAAFSELPGVVVTFIGNWPDEIDKKQVKFLPAMQQEELGKEFQNHDLFLFPSKHEACPNIVSEALSCGLPLLYEDSGGTTEIAAKYGKKLTGNHAQDLADLLAHYDNLQHLIRTDKEFFSVEQAAAAYVQILRMIQTP
ncbi:glycosyltransferase family 4 protein [Candidatus Uhrbacteria bacterium]|nr:glycosyltransferase family 4 protein [Candidatus Uhrbacteria bacterium]